MSYVSFLNPRVGESPFTLNQTGYLGGGGGGGGGGGRGRGAREERETTFNCGPLSLLTVVWG